MLLRKLFATLVTVGAMFAALSPMPVSAVPMTLQTANNTTGNQAWNGVGARFTVNSAISVSELGIFDSDQNGIAASSAAPLYAYLFTDLGVVLTSMTFDSTSQGTLDVASKYRFKSITPVILMPGTYVLAGYGWTANDQEHNCIIAGSCETFNTGGGLLTYKNSLFGSGTDSPGTFPTYVPPSTTNYFSGANMRFDSPSAVPEPATCLLLATGFVGLLGYRSK